MTNNQKFFIGIDLGGKEKKTTGLCVLRGTKNILSQSRPSPYFICALDVFGKNILRAINPYLKNTGVIAIDAPLTKGRGKGKMRLYEKFLSTSIFRKERVNPLPPALMPELFNFARELIEKLEKKGFVLGLNLIETFPTLVKKIGKENLILTDSSCQTENQKSALICAQAAFLHFQFKTRWLGYKDGFLFLPEISFWKKDWQKKFYQAWMGRPRLKYHRLITNIFSK